MSDFVVVAGEHRYRVPVSRRGQDELRRPLRHVVDEDPARWPHRGRLDFGRLETLLERFADAEEANRSALFVTRREASTLLAWAEHQLEVHRARGADLGTAEGLIPRLSYMLGLRNTLPGQEPGQPITTPRIPATG